MPQRQQRRRETPTLERDNTAELSGRDRRLANLTNAGKGRPRGSQNRVTRTVKDWLVAATEASGFDGEGEDGAIGYLVWLSRNEPVAYAALLGRIIPLQIQASLQGQVDHQHGGTVKLTSDQLAERLKARGLPVPQLIDHDPHEFDLIDGTTDEIEGGDDDA